MMVQNNGYDEPPGLYNKLVFDNNTKELVPEKSKPNLIPSNLLETFPENAERMLGKFVKGPIPLPGLAALSTRKTSKVLFTVCVIFYLNGYTPGEEFRFSYVWTDNFGLARSTVKRHLKLLASLGLIERRVEKSKSPFIRVDLKKWGYSRVVKI